VRQLCPVPNPAAIRKALRITTRVNNQVVQDAPTSEMIFGVADIISFLSISTTLLPYTLILTGTPAGAGAGRRPPKYLHEGDVVEVSIPGVGLLSNPIVAGPAPR